MYVCMYIIVFYLSTVVWNEESYICPKKFGFEFLYICLKQKCVKVHSALNCVYII